MNTWYRKDLGDGIAAFGPTKTIQDAFIKLAELQGLSSDLAVFSKYDLQSNNVTVYFTPSAKLLAEDFNAKPCEKPTPQDHLSLLVGDARSWEVHFPGYLSNH